MYGESETTVQRKIYDFAVLSNMAPAATKLLLTDLASGIDCVPDNYFRPEADHPNLAEIEAPDASSIPLIDLQGLFGPSHDDIIRQIGQACQQDGFFKIKNHGIPAEMVQAILNIAREFFRLPESERLKNYSDEPTKSTRLSTSLNPKTEKVPNWRDFLRLRCYPLEEYMPEWPANPPSVRRKELGEYCTKAREVLEAISESLGLGRDYMNKNWGKHGQHMAMNYYPPRPQPELTSVPDPNLITVLLQDDVPGLQVLRDGKWVAVDPIPNTFIVHMGYQMQRFFQVSIGCCDGCRRKLVKILYKIKGVSLVGMNIDEQLIEVRGDVDPEVIKTAIHKHLGKKAVLFE